jgi:Tfp pilus assembly pilus retraction ATPase PilT
MIRKGNTHQISSTIETGVQEGMISMRQSLEQFEREGLLSSEQKKAHLPHEIRHD